MTTRKGKIKIVQKDENSEHRVARIKDSKNIIVVKTENGEFLSVQESFPLLYSVGDRVELSIFSSNCSQCENSMFYNQDAKEFYCPACNKEYE